MKEWYRVGYLSKHRLTTSRSSRELFNYLYPFRPMAISHRFSIHLGYSYQRIPEPVLPKPRIHRPRQVCPMDRHQFGSNHPKRWLVCMDYESHQRRLATTDSPSRKVRVARVLKN